MENFRNLLPHQDTDESIYIFARPFFLAFLPWLLMGLFMALLGIVVIFITISTFPSLFDDPLSRNVFVLVASSYYLFLLPFLTVAFIDYYYDIMIVTDRRIIDIDQNNLFSRPISELSLEQVEDVTSHPKGILSTFFDYGDVRVQTAGSRENFEFKNILHPREIAGVILDLSDQAKERLGQGNLRPTGRVKAVINNEVFTQIEPLIEMGILSPGMTERTRNDVAESAEETGAEAGGNVSAQPKTVTPTPPVPVSPTSQVADPSPPAPNDDLDIIIDDPSSPKK